MLAVSVADQYQHNAQWMQRFAVFDAIGILVYTTEALYVRLVESETGRLY